MTSSRIDPGHPGSVREAHIARHREVEERIVEACHRAGRSRAEVTLLAVSKGHPDEAIAASHALGLRDFGESRVQAWLGRRERLAELGIRWHLVGALQTKKARHVTPAPPWLLHSVDREDLVKALAKRLDPALPVACLVQIDVDGEPQKGGCRPEELDALADRLAATPGLVLRGAMCIPRPPPEGDPRRAFARTRELLDTVGDRVDLTFGPPILSMGMSSDLEDAIAEGSNLVRIGTALFGPRDA